MLAAPRDRTQHPRERGQTHSEVTMSIREHEQFLKAWEWEAEKTIEVLRALPANQYDFRPDPKGRSLGEMAWHLSEGDAYMTHGIENGTFTSGSKPPGIERPRTIAELAPGYERIHRDAVERVKKLKPEDYDRTVPFFDGRPISVRDILWSTVLHHHIHHRGQLMLLCRQAGGRVPGVYGPNREDTEKMMEAAKGNA
jgi:uncharacterized damage-inducible protein DinB